MITSSHNSRIQTVRALLNRHSERKKQAAFVIEGVRLVEEAVNAGSIPQLILYSSSLSERGQAVLSALAANDCPIEEVEESLLRSLSDTETPQGILVVLPLLHKQLPPAWDFLVIADNLRDPGNLGTLLRTTAASGADGLIVTPGTTDPFAPKVVRSGMGAHFHTPILAAEWPEIEALCHARAPTPAQILIADSAAGVVSWKVDLTLPTALVIGGEAEGAQPAAFACADHTIQIPMPGKSESLNAAVAAGILIFEVVRQRST